MLKRTAMILLFSLVLSLAGSTTYAQKAGVPLDVWTMERLDLDVTVDPGRSIAVQGTMTVKLQDEMSNALAFGINSRDTTMRFQSLEAEGTAAEIRRYKADSPVYAAILRMPRAFHRGDTLRVTFVLKSEKESSQLHIGKDAVFASWVERWYPLPAAAMLGKASSASPGSTTFHLPRGWRSVSNGSLQSSSTNGGHTIERWTTETPAARSFVAAPFASVPSVESGGRKISFYLLRPRASAEEQARALARSLEAMEARFGPYPYATYNVAEVPEGISFAAASEQGFIMVRSSVLDDVGASLPLFAHEAAHGWWGNLVGNEGPGGMMLSEALAQYGAVISIEAVEGIAARDRFLRFSRKGYNPLQCALGYFYIWGEGGDKPLSLLDEDKWDHNLSDSKGMWFYHMLRLKVGDDVFFGTLRSIIHDFANSNLTMAELRRRFTERSGNPTLASFLEQWLDRSGAPVIDLDWWSVERGAKVEIHFEQRQPGQPFVLPVEIALALDDGSTMRQVVNLSQRSTSVTLPTPSRVLAVMLDPDFHLLIWRPEYGPRPQH